MTAIPDDWNDKMATCHNYTLNNRYFLFDNQKCGWISISALNAIQVHTNHCITNNQNTTINPRQILLDNTKNTTQHQM